MIALSLPDEISVVELGGSVTTERAIANEWRSTQDEPRASTGVVLIYEGRAYGWKNALRDPHHERPGAVAVDPAGKMWMATGGNYEDGALTWVPYG